MTQEEKQGAPELTEQEELELRQLAELILETTVSEELFSDIRELSEQVLALVRGNSEELEYSGWGPKDAWTSFTVYSKLDEILRDLLLGARDEDADPDLEDRQLTEAAESYDLRATLEEQMAIGDLDGGEAQPLCREELESFQFAIEDKIGSEVALDELAELVGSSVPDFARDARSHSWSDPAVVEAATNFYLDSLGPAALGELLDEQPSDQVGWLLAAEDLETLPDGIREKLASISHIGEAKAEEFEGEDYPLTEDERESFVQKLGELIESRVKSAEADFAADELEEEIPEDYEPRALTDVEELVVNDPLVIATHAEMKEHPELWTVADDLSLEDGPTDTSDEGEWGVAEIDGEGEPEVDGDFALEDLSEESEHSEGPHHHHSHVHQILSEELRGLDDYDGEPADEREIATLALIAEGIVYTELSEILLQDLLAEADQLIRKSRLSGPDWWMTIEAAEDVADLISKLLSGEPWPIFAPDASDEVLRREGNAHQSRLKSLAESYPLDPEPTEAEEQELTEDEYIASYDPSRWPSMGATVDVAIFTFFGNTLQVLLIERGNHPEKGKWALPGGFVNPDESLLQGALRELQEETGVKLEDERLMKQIGSYGYPGRDRRGYIISTLYTTLLKEVPTVQAADDAAKARFFPVAEALGSSMELAFDHAVLLKDARDRIALQYEDRDR